MSDINVKINIVSQAAQASVNGLAKGAQNAEKGFKGLNVSIKQGSSLLTSFAGNLFAIGASKVIGAVSRGFSNLASEVFEATKSLEVARTKFEVLTGSAAAANKIIRELQEFSARTPFQFEDIAQASQRLLSFGFSLDEVKTNLQDLGDVSAASGADISELSLIFGQVRAAGKLTGERLLQLQERAIPIGPALAKSLGVAESSIRDLVSQGKVDFATFEKAFQSLNEQGEFAFEGMEKRSQTLEGRISTLKDNFQLFAAQIGESVAPALKAGVTVLTEFIQSFGRSAELQQFLDAMANSIPTAIQVMSSALIIGIRVFNALRLAAGIVNIVFYDIVAGALAAAEATLEFAQSAGKFLGFDTSGIDASRESINNLKNAAKSTASEIDASNDQIVESEQKLVDSINTGTKVIVQRYNEEKRLAEEAKNAVVNTEQEKLKAEQQAQTERLAQLMKAQQERLAFLQGQQVLEDELFLAQQEEKLLQDEQITEQERLKLQAIANERALARENETLALLKDQQQTAETQAQITKIETEQIKRRNKLKADEAAYERKVQQERLQQYASMFGALAELSATGGARIFKITQGLQLAQATVAGYAAIQQAASSAPFPANIPAIITETARAAASIIRIKQASPTFQDGGIVGGGQFSGDNVIARVNSGEMILNRQQQAQLFNLANGTGGSGVTEITTVVQIGEEEIARAVSRQVAQGFQLGEGGV